jgi:serine/threonine protein kinase
VTEWLIALLGVLEYLHTRMPPILHRDIKPANVMIRTDGSPALVDFGAVRNVFRDPSESGSTIVGTYGYVPYEQMMGQASPASDLYALAATFLHLITGREPPSFLSDAGRLVVPADLPCGEPLRSVLARMLDAAPAARYQSARDVRTALRGGSTALVPSPAASAALTLGPVPRPITGETAILLKRLAHSPWQLMSPQEKPGTKWSLSDVFLVGLFSVLTAGILPAVFFSLYASRKKRFKKFLAHGMPATARILEMTPEDVAFDVKITRVRYEFTVDGRAYRDSDTVLPAISTRWDPGQEIQVLYMPDADYDSVIVSTA